MEAQARAEPVTSEEAHFLLGRSVMHLVTYEADWRRNSSRLISGTSFKAANSSSAASYCPHIPHTFLAPVEVLPHPSLQPAKL